MGKIRQNDCVKNEINIESMRKEIPYVQYNEGRINVGDTSGEVTVF